jgi:hypothetical protein
VDFLWIGMKIEYLSKKERRPTLKQGKLTRYIHKKSSFLCLATGF